MTSFFASPTPGGALCARLGRTVPEWAAPGLQLSHTVLCKYCGLPADRGASHERADLCIRALQQEIATLRKALEELKPGAVDGPTPNRDAPPSTSPQKRTPK